MEGSHCRGSNIDRWLGLGLRVDLPGGLANKHQAAKIGRSINNKPACVMIKITTPLWCIGASSICQRMLRIGMENNSTIYEPQFGRRGRERVLRVLAPRWKRCMILAQNYYSYAPKYFWPLFAVRRLHNGQMSRILCYTRYGV